MNKLFEKIEDKVLPIATKIGNQRHLLAIRDGFTVIMPLMIIGAFAVAINNLPIPAFQNFMNSIFTYIANETPIWKNFGGNIWSGSFAIMALIMSFLVAYNLGQSYKMNGLITGVTSFASFCALGGVSGADSKGLFLALVVALLATELMRALGKVSGLRVRMPESVPQGVSDSFSSMIPVMITLMAFALVGTILLRIGIPNIVDTFYEAFQKPFMGLSNSLVSAIILAFIPPFLWFFGLHGANMIDPFMQTINVGAMQENIDALAKGLPAPNLVSKPFFDAFVNMGGTGTTIALLIAVFIVGRKNRHLSAISKLSVGPGIFNINEPLTFGIPIVLNPILFIPYVFGPVIITVVAYFATTSGLVPVCRNPIPWVTPPIIGGFLATESIAGGALALVNIAIMTALYIPFILMFNRSEAEN